MITFKDFKIGDFVIYGGETKCIDLKIARIESEYGFIARGYSISIVAILNTDNGEVVLSSNNFGKYLTNREYVLINEDIKNKLCKLLTFQ